MKLALVILFLAGCHEISASGLPASLLSAKSQLAELKMKLDADIAKLPVMPTVEAPKLKPQAGLPAMNGKVPDIAGRKATLESLKAKLTAMQEQVKSGQPGAQFLVGMKQVLEESSNVEMTDLKVPAFKPRSYKAAKSSMSVAAKALPKIELLENRNVQNFTAEMFRLHEEGTDLHRRLLEYKRVQRNEMTDVVFDIFLEMVQILGDSTEDLWRTRQSVQDMIDNKDADNTCVAVQKARFAERNLFSGREMNFCVQFVLTPTRQHFATIFYPLMEIASLFTSSMQYVILESSMFTNYARDQEALIEFVENELHSIEEIWYNNLMVAFNWEQHRFDDEMLLHREELRECLFFLEANYNRVTDDIKAALDGCADEPTKGRPMQFKPSF